MKNACCALALALPALPLYAGQPLVTDDAAVVAPRTCQVETWTRRTGDSRETWLQPACNFGGDLELAVGAGRIAAEGEPRSSGIVLQAKWARPRGEHDAWAFGAVAGAARDTQAPRGHLAFQSRYAVGLASWHPRDGVEIDLNLGLAHVDRLGGHALAGVALQYALAPRLQMLAEIFRDEPGAGKFQAGLRWIVVPDRLEAFASYGNRLHPLPGAWSVVTGIRIQTPAFLR